MSKLKEADFYYGAVLSTLLNNHICPALIEGGTDRQIYDFTTDEKDFRLFVKYRSMPIETKKAGYRSWQFCFSPSDIQELTDYCKQDSHFSLGLLCGDNPMNQSQYAVLQKEEIKKLLQCGKTSLTIGLTQGQHAFRISMGGGKDNDLLISTNRKY